MTTDDRLVRWVLASVETAARDASAPGQERSDLRRLLLYELYELADDAPGEFTAEEWREAIDLATVCVDLLADGGADLELASDQAVVDFSSWGRTVTVAMPSAVWRVLHPLVEAVSLTLPVATPAEWIEALRTQVRAVAFAGPWGPPDPKAVALVGPLAEVVAELRDGFDG